MESFKESYVLQTLVTLANDSGHIVFFVLWVFIDWQFTAKIIAFFLEMNCSTPG